MQRLLQLGHGVGPQAFVCEGALVFLGAAPAGHEEAERKESETNRVGKVESKLQFKPAEGAGIGMCFE